LLRNEDVNEKANEEVDLENGGAVRGQLLLLLLLDDD
jgi:hypothetical protein